MLNFNILAYLLYGLGTIVIIYYLGRYFHHYGRVYILALYKDRPQLADSTNNLLLLLYYLLNMGYAIIQFYFWETIVTLPHLLHSLTTQFATIILLLGFIHYLNLFTIYFISSRQQQPQL